MLVEAFATKRVVVRSVGLAFWSAVDALSTAFWRRLLTLRPLSSSEDVKESESDCGGGVAALLRKLALAPRFLNVGIVGVASSAMAVASYGGILGCAVSARRGDYYTRKDAKYGDGEAARMS